MAIHHRAKANLESPLLGDTIFRSNSMGGGYKKLKGSRGSGFLVGLLIFVVLVCLGSIFYPEISWLQQRRRDLQREEESANAPVLVSYSYFEKDGIQKENFEFFITVGMGLGSHTSAPENTDFVVVVNGKVCRPCSRLYPLLKETEPDLPSLSYAYVGDHVTVLRRKANEGMDFAAHNTTLEWLQSRGQLKKYKYFIFLNSSVRGPFVPSYMPGQWQWTRAYTDRLVGDVKAVSSSLVCLPEVDAGGFGPKLESWAFALDGDGLTSLVEDEVFRTRECKLCNDGIVVMGEYGLTASLMKRGYNVDTLMSKYRQVDWRDRRHWHCNNNVHPSRHGTYDSISMHPFETVFIKASWHVGEPFVDKYSGWMLAQAMGEDTTDGQFDERMYRYAISPEAQESHNVAECYNVLRLPLQGQITHTIKK